MLQVLGALIAPAVLVSATGQFILSTANRLALTTDRARELARHLDKLERSRNEVPREQRLRVQRQLLSTLQRARAQQRALVLFYTAAVCFVLCSLMLGVEMLMYLLPPWLPVALGLTGVVLLLFACSLLVLETRKLVTTLQAESEHHDPPLPS
jgi:hypothetical protein